MTGFNEFLEGLLANNHNVVIREFDHRTAAAATAVGSVDTMQVMAAHGARLYFESPASLNGQLRDNQRGQIPDAELEEWFTPDAYDPAKGWSDQPYDEMFVNAREQGVQLRFHDHGYENILNPEFPEHLVEQGEYAMGLAMQGDDDCLQNYLNSLPEVDAAAIEAGINSAFDERLNGNGDMVNASFVNVNSEGKPTVSVIGAKHDGFYNHLQETAAQEGLSTVDVTVFDSEHPVPKYLRNEDGVTIDNDLFGDYAYDTYTQQEYHIPPGSQAREDFLTYMDTLSVEKESPIMQGDCPAPPWQVKPEPIQPITIEPMAPGFTVQPPPEQSAPAAPTLPVFDLPADVLAQVNGAGACLNGAGCGVNPEYPPLANGQTVSGQHVPGQEQQRDNGAALGG